MSKVEFLPVSGGYAADVSRARRVGFTRHDLLFVVCVVASAVGFSVLLTLLLAPQTTRALLMSITIPFAVATPASLYLVRQRAKVAALNAQLTELLRRDSLTGALSRRAFLAEVSSRSGEGGVFVLLDVDHFKAVNDTYGHPVGDAVLVQLVDRLGKAAGPDALIGRLGGEEFAVFLPQMAASDGLALAETLRSAVACRPMDAPTASLTVTISLGVAALSDGRSLNTALAAADSALYVAKNQGRNRSAVHGSSPAPEDALLKMQSPA